MAAGAGMASMDVGMQPRAGDAATQLDLVLDPRMGLPLFGIKSEKERAGDESSPPAAFALTPSMFDGGNPFDCASIYADDLPSDAAPAIFVATPETSRSTPETPPPPSPPPPPRGARKPRDRPGRRSSSAAPPPPARDKPPARKKPRTRARAEPPEARSSTRPDAKRNRCLERNRVAASKCREKKKQWVHELESTREELEERHARLQREYSGLLDEATLIKTALMDHSVCNDRNIDMWIESEAVRFVRRANQRHRDGRRGAGDGRHSSITSLASLNSQAESVAQSSTTAPTEYTHLSPPGPKGDAITFDYMPDDMFADAG